MPPSGLKLLQVSPERVPVSRVTVLEEGSSPAPPAGSEPLVRLKETEVVA